MSRLQETYPWLSPLADDHFDHLDRLVRAESIARGDTGQDFDKRRALHALGMRDALLHLIILADHANDPAACNAVNFIITTLAKAEIAIHSRYVGSRHRGMDTEQILSEMDDRNRKIVEEARRLQGTGVSRGLARRIKENLNLEISPRQIQRIIKECDMTR